MAIGASSMNGSEKLRIAGDSQFDGKITINGSNVLEATALSGSFNFNIQNTNTSGTLNLMGVNSGGATNLLTITNNTVLPKLNFPSGFWVNGNSTNISETELFYLDGVTSNIQNQLNSLSSQQSTNTTNIGTNSSNITALQTQQSTNTSNISSLTSQQSQNTSAISTNTSNISTNTGSISSLQSQQSTNTSNISALQSQQSTNTGNISTNAGNITNIKNKYDFTGSVANGKLLIGSGANYTVGELASSDNTVTITKSAGGIDLVVPSSTSLSAGTGINITAPGVINYDIQKESAYTTPASADTMLMFDSANSLTKKITFNNFNAGLQSQITSNDTDITNLTTQQNTNTSAIATNTSNISSLTTQQNTNTSAIATNTSNISSLTTQQNTNTSAIATNTSNISSLTTQQNTNTSAIATNTSNISSLTTQQSTNTSNISALTTQQNTNTSNISALTTQQNTNTSNISALTTQQNTNTSNISTNTSNIASNTAAISNLVSTANSTNFGTTASSGITLGNNSQTLALNSASMNCISAGKNFFRSNLSSGLGFQVQGYNSTGSAYSSVLEIHNVSGGGAFPYLNLLMGNGFSINQYTGQNRNLIVDTNGKLNISNDLPITLTGGDGINISGSNAIEVDISKQVAITTPANDDVFIVERNTGVINKIAYSDMGIGVTAGNAIAVSGTTVNVEISKPSSITTPASGDLFLLEQAVDGVLKNISFSDLSSSLTVDLTTATSIGTAAGSPITLGNAGNQILNLVGSIALTSVNNYIQNRSSVSTGVGWYVSGYNSTDSTYYTTLSVDNTSVSGEKPNLKIMDGAGFTNTASKTLTTDANGKLLWATPSSGGIAQSEDTTNNFIKLGDQAVNNITFPAGSNSSMVMGFPSITSLTGNFNSNFVWSGGSLNTSIGNFNTSILIGWSPFFGFNSAVPSNKIESSVAIGHGVAQYVFGCYESVFIGTGAGYLNGNSNQCTFVGRFAKSNSYNSGYSNSTAIGEQAEITSSNQAAIGNSSVNSFRIYGSWSNVSDRRDKYDIIDTQFGLDFINKLRVVDYKYNYRNRYKHFNDETKENYYETNNKQYACKRTHTGLISQEVKEVLDSENKDHSMFQINNYSDSETNTDDAQFIVYQETISMCVKAIQELSARVIELEKKIN